MGRIKYDSLRNTFNVLSPGGNFSKYNHMFCIDKIKVVLLIHHIQENLQSKACRLRNGIIAGLKFKNIHVYERVGKGMRFLFKEYQDSLPEN